ncbi:MAG: peptide ABC transporter substrate-binding protein [Ruminococcaceae bacterium]|nr:peptide ABC transporter substrate-binding protein [Oscillospiraceae bacterium]
MKKLLSLILAVIVVCTSFAACSTLEKGDKGAVITMYLADEIYDYDPAVGFTDTATAKFLSLMFEGLTTLDEEGEWQKAMMKSYKYLEPEFEGDTYKLEITLRDTKWSDGRTVQANDFVYAWKRIMEPTFKCEAASMLYDLKNAREVKMGDASVDDLGVYAIDTYVLQIEFTKDVDLDEFFKNCASVALVPLREDSVSSNKDWAKRASSMVTNGPYDPRKIDFGKQLTLERSAYYYRDTDSEQALDKYVIPYRIIVLYNYGDSKAQLEKFEAGSIFYLGEIALEARKDYSGKAEVRDSAITTSLYFNTQNKLFEKKEVRQALSIALDRQAIAESLVFAKPATGLVPFGVDDANGKGDFRETADKSAKLIETSANVEEAKSLLKKAGVTSGSFTLSVRDNEADVAVAKAVAETWKSLGFTVKVKELNAVELPATEKNQSAVYEDKYATAYAAGDFDVILVDYNVLSPNAFGVLAPFATEYSGNGILLDAQSDKSEKINHITGYASEAYSKLIDKAYAAEKSEDELAALHDAEKQLLDDMPVIPVVFQQDAYLASGELSGIATTYWGRDFKRTKMKNYMEYKESIQNELNEDEAEGD